MKKTIFTLPLFLLLGIIFPIVPAFASSVITSDTFNGTPGDTVPQYNPTDYYLASGYYTDNNANLVIANGGGLKISPASTLNAGGFNTDMTQFGSPTYYCESINFTRNPSDNEVFPELGLHNQNRTFGPITGGTGFTSEFDFHFDTSTVRLEIYNFATGSDLVPYQTFAFNSSTNDHTVKVCDNNGIVTNYVDGVAKETTSYNGATG